MRKNSKLGFVLIISSLFLMSLFFVTSSINIMDNLQNDDLSQLDLSIGGDYTCFVNYTDDGDFSSYYVYQGSPHTTSFNGDHAYVKLQDDTGPGEVRIRKYLNWSSEFISDIAVHYRIKASFGGGGSIGIYFKMFYADSTYLWLSYFYTMGVDKDITEWNTVYPNQSKTLDYVQIFLFYDAPAATTLEFWLYDETYNGYSPCIKNWEIHPFNMEINQPHFFTGEFYNQSSQKVEFLFIETGNEMEIQLIADWTQNNYYSTNTSFYRRGIYTYRYVSRNDWGINTYTPEYQIFVHAIEYPKIAYLNIRSYEYRDVPETLFYIYLGEDESTSLFNFRNTYGNWVTMGTCTWAFGYERIVFNCSNGGIKSDFSHIQSGIQYELTNILLSFDIKTSENWSVIIVDPTIYDMDYLLNIDPIYHNKWIHVNIPFYMFQNFDSANNFMGELGFYGNGFYEIANIKISRNHDSNFLINYSKEIYNTTEIEKLDTFSFFNYPLQPNATINSVKNWNNYTNWLNNSYDLSCEINYNCENSTHLDNISDIINTGDSYWKLDESSGTNTQDSWGNDNNGTLVNMAGTEWESGKFNNALHFDGVNDRVDLADTKTFSSSAGTISLWFKSDVNTNTHTTNKWLLGRNRGGNNIGDLGIHFANSYSDKLLFIIQTGSVTRLILSDAINFNADQWYFFVGTWNSSEFVMYIDNVRQADVDPGVTLYAHNLDHMCIAQQSTGAPMNTETFDGIIDELRIYKRVLTVNEMQVLYNGFSVNETLIFNFTQIEQNSLYNITLTGNVTLSNSDNYTIGFYNFTNSEFIYQQFNESLINYSLSFHYFNTTNIILRLNYTSQESFYEGINLTIHICYFTYSNSSYFRYYDLNISTFYLYYNFTINQTTFENSNMTFEWRTSTDNSTWGSWNTNLIINNYDNQYLHYRINFTTNSWNTSYFYAADLFFEYQNITFYYINSQLNTTIQRLRFVNNVTFYCNITHNANSFNSSISIYNFTSSTYENISTIQNITYQMNSNQNSSNGLVKMNFTLMSTIPFTLNFSQCFIYVNNSDFQKFVIININQSLQGINELSFWYNFSDIRSNLYVEFYNNSWYEIANLSKTPLSCGLGNGSATTRFWQYWNNITVNNYNATRLKFILRTPETEYDFSILEVKRFEIINYSIYRLESEINRQRYDILEFLQLSSTLLIIDFAGREIYRELINYSTFIDIYINIAEITIINYENYTVWIEFIIYNVGVVYAIPPNTERNILILLGDYYITITNDYNIILDIREISITTTNKTTIEIGVALPSIEIPEYTLLDLILEALIIIWEWLTTTLLGLITFGISIFSIIFLIYRKIKGKKKDEEKEIKKAYKRGFTAGLKSGQKGKGRQLF